MSSVDSSLHEHYDAIVIGAGLGGLTAGALFAKAGYRVLLLEKNHAFGGAATTYHKGQMKIEASLHQTTNPAHNLDPNGEIFAALDLYKDIDFVPIDHFYEVRSPLIGAPLTIPHGLKRLCEGLIERFPDDAENIHRFIYQLKSIQQAIRLLSDKHDSGWWLRHAAELPFRLWPILRDLRASVCDVMDSYFGNNEAIKIALCANLHYYSDDPQRMWWLIYALAQGGYFSGGGHYVKGGSQALSDQLVARIRSEHGEALTNQTVVKIQLSENGAVRGVEYRANADGERKTAYAPVVFANASPHAIASMLPQRERDEFMAAYRDKPLSISLFSMTFGLNRRPSELGFTAYSTELLPAWLDRLSDIGSCIGIGAGEVELPPISVVDYSHIDSGLVEGSIYPVNVVGVDRISNWEGLDDNAYQARKRDWLDAVTNRLEREWPGFSAAVVQRELATARTMRDYLGTPQGALYGFAPNVPKALWSAPNSPETSVQGLWLASAFGGGGGFTGAMMSGGNAAKAALLALSRSSL